MTAFWVVWPTVKSLYSLPALKCFFQKEGNVILIRTLTGLRWFDIDCTDNEDALYLDKVALIDNFAHSCHILFQNMFHRIEKSDIVCIRDDQCDILWQCITWINKGFLFANQKQSFEAFLSTHTLTIDPYNSFFINLVLTPPISFSKKHILNSASVLLISGILIPVGFCLSLTLDEKCGINHIIGLETILPNTVLYRFLLNVVILR